MSNAPKIVKFKSLSDIAVRFHSDLKDLDFVLLYAYNGTGKTRLSMEFKNRGKKGGQDKRDTLYFNAFTEDLFHWDNDLKYDADRVLKINTDSNFFNGFRQLALEDKIFEYLQRYATFNFKIDYEKWEISFSKEIANPAYKPDNEEPVTIVQSNIKVSRGEENIFIWCIFLAICELTIDGAEAYDWVKYIYIDDPISSLDDNNAIAVASDLSNLLQKGIGKISVIISTHHHLFFNVICNELKKRKCKRYFLHKNGSCGYTLRATDETPFFHHVALLSELKKLIPKEDQTLDDVSIKTYHFNMLRSILERLRLFSGITIFLCAYTV